MKAKKIFAMMTAVALLALLLVASGFETTRPRTTAEAAPPGWGNNVLPLRAGSKGVGAFPPERPSAQGGAPMLISYQGMLTDPTTGKSVADGNYSVTFRIYTAQRGGSPIWSETHPTVSVSGGLFNVLLGSKTSLSATVFSGTDRWLEVVVEGKTLSPRQRIASVAYSIQAQEAKNADMLDGQHGSYYQARVSGACSVGSTIRAINADGTVVCQTDAPLNRPLAPSANTITTLESAGLVGLYTSVTIGADGLGLISYHDHTNHVLKVAHCSNPFCVPYFRRR